MLMLQTAFQMRVTKDNKDLLKAAVKVVVAVATQGLQDDKYEI
jgi:hypothetical protein